MEVMTYSSGCIFLPGAADGSVSMEGNLTRMIYAGQAVVVSMGETVEAFEAFGGWNPGAALSIRVGMRLAPWFDSPNWGAKGQGYEPISVPRETLDAKGRNPQSTIGSVARCVRYIRKVGRMSSGQRSHGIG